MQILRFQDENLEYHGPANRTPCDFDVRRTITLLLPKSIIQEIISVILRKTKRSYHKRIAFT